MKTKRKPGRPKSDRKREKPLYVRLLSDEDAAFRKAAEDAGLDLSNWVRISLRKAAGI